MRWLNNHNGHDHADHNQEKTLTGKVRAYVRNMFRSNKCKSMSHGSFDIVRSMSWARGENWRRNHPKSLNKNHHK